MQKRTAKDVIADLPTNAWSVLNTDKTLVIEIRPGSIGYFPVKHFDTETEAEAFAARMNTEFGVTIQQRRAMEYGSCFGWDAPIADPLNWNENGVSK